MIKKTKKLVIYGKSHFFDQKLLNMSNLVKTHRNSLLFLVKYSKLNPVINYYDWMKKIFVNLTKKFKIFYFLKS
jgi:hypothetical protein